MLAANPPAITRKPDWIVKELLAFNLETSLFQHEPR
jgi:hypothetical protein